jgi:hypothetical protein
MRPTRSRTGPRRHHRACNERAIRQGQSGSLTGTGRQRLLAYTTPLTGAVADLRNWLHRLVPVGSPWPRACHIRATTGRSVGSRRDRSGHSRRGSALLRRGGQGRSRTADLPLFSSTALPELPSNAVAARRASSDAGSRWRHVLLDLSLDHAGLETGSRSSQRVFRVPGASQGTSCSDARSACHQPRSAAVSQGTASMAATAGQRCCSTMRRSRCYGVNSFQCPSETTSTFPSVTLMAV